MMRTWSSGISLGLLIESRVAELNTLIISKFPLTVLPYTHNIARGNGYVKCFFSVLRKKCDYLLVRCECSYQPNKDLHSQRDSRLRSAQAILLLVPSPTALLQ